MKKIAFALLPLLLACDLGAPGREELRACRAATELVVPDHEAGFYDCAAAGYGRGCQSTYAACISDAYRAEADCVSSLGEQPRLADCNARVWGFISRCLNAPGEMDAETCFDMATAVRCE